VSAIKRILGDNTAHVEQCNASDQANVDYCSKSETHVAGPWSFGELTNQGHRTDLDTLCAGVVDGRTDYELATENPVSYAKFGSHIHRLRNALNVPKWRDSVTTHVFVGPTGIGKSYFVHKTEPDLYAVTYSPGRIWWDGYTGQKTILLDEYSG